MTKQFFVSITIAIFSCIFIGCELNTGVPDFVYTTLIIKNQSNQTLTEVRYEGKTVFELKAGDTHIFRLENIEGSSAVFFKVNSVSLRTFEHVVIQRGKQGECIIHDDLLVIKESENTPVSLRKVVKL